MSLTKATFSMINGASANVLDFGADSSGVADSTSAFNAAIATGKKVFAPAGTYKINLNLTTSNVYIYGEGVEVTFFRPFVAAGAVIALDAETPNTILQNFTFNDFTILGSSKAGHGFYIAPTTGNNGCDHISMTNINVRQCANGLRLQGRSIWNSYRNCNFDFNVVGIFISTDKAVNAWNFMSCRTARNDSHGFYAASTEVSGMIGFTFTNFNSEYNGEDTAAADAFGLYANGANGWELINCVLEGNGQSLVSQNGYGVIFQGTNSGIVIDGIWAVGSKFPIVFQGILNGGRIDNAYFVSQIHGGLAGIIIDLLWNNNPKLEVGRAIRGSILNNIDVNGNYSTIDGFNWVSNVVGGTVQMQYSKNVTIGTNNASQTITSFGSLQPGQEITVFNWPGATANTVTIDSTLMADSVSVVLSAWQARKFIVVGFPATGKLVAIS